MKNLLFMCLLVSASIYAMEDKQLYLHKFQSDIEVAQDIQNSLMDHPLTDSSTLMRRATIAGDVDLAIEQLQQDIELADEELMTKIRFEMCLVVEQLKQLKEDILSGHNRNQTPPLTLYL